jgi:hypothetical protein
MGCQSNQPLLAGGLTSGIKRKAISDCFMLPLWRWWSSKMATTKRGKRGNRKVRSRFFSRPTFPALVSHGGIQRRTDAVFMPGVEHQSRLRPVTLATRFKIAIWDQSCEYIIHGYKSVSVDSIDQRLHILYFLGFTWIITVHINQGKVPFRWFDFF